MRLAYDLRYATDHFPGIGTFAWALAQGLLAIGGFEEIVFLWDPRAANSRFDLAAVRSHPRAQWHEVDVPPLSWGTAHGTGSCLERLDADVFLSPFWLRPEGTRVPCVLTLHDVLPLLRAGGASPPRRWMFRWAMRRAAGAEAVLTVSRFSRGEILLHTPIPSARLHVVPEGVLPPTRAQLRPAGVPAGPFALTVGANRVHKGHDTLAAVWRSFAAAAPLTLVSAGSIDPRRFSLASAARELSGVAALGQVSPAELEWLYANATLVLVPSRYEGFGLPLLEAAARGAPVIASDITALRETGDGVARFVGERDIDGWARAIHELLESPSARDAMGNVGRRRALEYGYAACAERVMVVLNAVARRSGAVLA